MRIDPESITTASGIPDDEIHKLIGEYLARFEDEEMRLKAEQRPNRPIPKRLDEIRHLIGAEKAEYRTGPGLEIPDLSSVERLQALFVWDGTRESMDKVQLVRVRPLTVSSAMA